MSERHKRKNARKMLARAGYRAGGHISPSDKREDESADKKMIKRAISEHETQEHGGKHSHIKLKEGGYAHGGSAALRGDRKPRGGKSKGHHTTVVVNAGGGHPIPVPVPKPIPIPVGGAGPGAGAGGPPPPPPGAMGMAGPPGMPPGGPMKRGGHARFKKGGKIKGYPIGDGAGGGEGRKEKAKAYGARV